jgi:GNAT superfamily N-acetyltransferase
MVELPESRYETVATLVETVPFDRVFARAVVRGFQEGRIFADDPARPGIALIHHSCGASLLCGDPAGAAAAGESALRVVTNLLLAEQRLDANRFRLYCHPDTWNGKLAAALDGRLIRYSDFESRGIADPDVILRRMASAPEGTVIAWTRVRFAFDGASFFRTGGETVRPPEGCSIVPMDSHLFERAGGTVAPNIFWRTADLFLEHGFGYCLIAPDGELASASFSAYIDGEEVDVGIETHPAFRGRGFAGIICRTMIECCLERGLRPVWGCRKDNTGSLRLAHKLGFYEILYHPTYFDATFTMTTKE